MATAIEAVRLWIRDTDPDPTKQLFTDSQLQIFLDTALGNTLVAAAYALYALAADKAKIGSLREIYQIRLDTSRMSQSLIQVADSLRKLAASVPSAVLTPLTPQTGTELGDEELRRRMLTFEYETLADTDNLYASIV